MSAATPLPAAAPGAHRVAFWPHTDDPRVASYRLRCAQIVHGLRGQGVAALELPHRRPALQAATGGWLVLSKRYDAATLQAALAQRAAGGSRIALDLCDNHFVHASDPDGRLAARAAQLRSACAAVDRVVAASDALAEVVRAEVPGVDVRVVPDAAEPPQPAGWTTALRHPGDWRRLQRLRGWLAAQGTAPGRRAVWFGNQGSPGVDGGMADLARLRPALEAAASQQPLSLSVISNGAEAFDALVRGWRLPVAYLPWSAATFSAALQAHSVALIPIGLNPFTRCKTANRVLSAALHGLNVVADAIPAYEPLRTGCVLDDWAWGLGGYLDDAAARAAHRARLQALVAGRFTLAHILADWRAALDLG